MCLSLAKTPELPFPLFSDYLSFQNLFCPSTASGQVRSPLPKSLLSPEARFSPHSDRRCRWPQTSDVYFRNRFTHWLYRTEPPPKPACACPSIAVPLRCLPRRASTAPCRVQCPSHGSGVPALPQIWAVLWDQGAAGGSWGAGGHLKDRLGGKGSGGGNGTPRNRSSGGPSPPLFLSPALIDLQHLSDTFPLTVSL